MSQKSANFAAEMDEGTRNGSLVCWKLALVVNKLR